MALVSVAFLFSSGVAFAADRVVFKKRAINESNESWTLDLEFHFDKPPDIVYVPISFEFQQTVYYENTLEDGQEKPRMRRVPIEFKQPLIETQDVGFLDAGSGKTMSRTRFTFKLTRARGFEAGEYKVTVTNKRSGRKLGQPVPLTLNGENEVIDRRAISFDGERKKPKEDKPKSWEEQPKPEDDPNSEAYWASGPTETEREDPDLPPPAHMQEKPGGCGCRIPGAPHQGLPRKATGSLFLMVLLAGAGLVRRTRR